MTAHEPAPPLAEVKTTDNGTQNENDHDSWRPINLNTLHDKPPVQPHLGNVGVLYPGKRHVFSGPQESAKTLAVYILALEVVRAGLTVILIDFEMGAYDARDRLRDLGATPQDFQRIHYLEPETPASTRRINELINLNPALVIIDAAAGAFQLENLDDNKRGDVERFTALYVKLFWRASIATIVLDHVVKTSENRGKYAIGSERKVGGADVHLGFEVVTPISRGKTGHYKIVTHKDRGGFLKRGKLADLELRSDPTTHAITWTFKAAEATEDVFRPTHLMEKISRHLEPLTMPLSRNEISKQVRGANDGKSAAITRLTEEGYCVDTGTPSAGAISSIRPYRQNDDPWPNLSASPHLSASSPSEGSSSPLRLSASLQGSGEGGEVEDTLTANHLFPALSWHSDHEEE